MTAFDLMQNMLTTGQLRSYTLPSLNYLNTNTVTNTFQLKWLLDFVWEEMSKFYGKSHTTVLNDTFSVWSISKHIVQY